MTVRVTSHSNAERCVYLGESLQVEPSKWVVFLHGGGRKVLQGLGCAREARSEALTRGGLFNILIVVNGTAKTERRVN